MFRRATDDGQVKHEGSSYQYGSEVAGLGQLPEIPARGGAHFVELNILQYAKTRTIDEEFVRKGGLHINDSMSVCRVQGDGLERSSMPNFGAVSYTHLTLPTICSV